MAESGVNKGFFEIERSENLRFYAQFTPNFKNCDKNRYLKLNILSEKTEIAIY